MASRVLRLVSCLFVLVLALASVSLISAAASASPRSGTTPSKHAVAKASQGASLHAAVHAEAASEPASVDDDDDDDDNDNDDNDDNDCDDDCADPGGLGPASHLPGPSVGAESAFGLESVTGASPGTRELPEDPPETA